MDVPVTVATVQADGAPGASGCRPPHLAGIILRHGVGGGCCRPRRVSQPDDSGSRASRGGARAGNVSVEVDGRSASGVMTPTATPLIETATRAFAGGSSSRVRACTAIVTGVSPARSSGRSSSARAPSIQRSSPHVSAARRPSRPGDIASRSHRAPYRAIARAVPAPADRTVQPAGPCAMRTTRSPETRTGRRTAAASAPSPAAARSGRTTAARSRAACCRHTAPSAVDSTRSRREHDERPEPAPVVAPVAESRTPAPARECTRQLTKRRPPNDQPAFQSAVDPLIHAISSTMSSVASAQRHARVT